MVISHSRWESSTLSLIPREPDSSDESQSSPKVQWHRDTGAQDRGSSPPQSLNSEALVCPAMPLLSVTATPSRALPRKVGRTPQSVLCRRSGGAASPRPRLRSTPPSLFLDPPAGLGPTAPPADISVTGPHFARVDRGGFHLARPDPYIDPPEISPDASPPLLRPLTWKASSQAHVRECAPVGS